MLLQVHGVGIRRSRNSISHKLKYNVMPNIKVVNHVETLGEGKTYTAQQPFQPLQPGQGVRGDDSFPLASPVNIEPYPLKAKSFSVPNMGGITDEQGLKVYDNSAPNWNLKAREKLGLEKEKKD